MQEELGGWEAFLGVEEQEENYGIYVFIEIFKDESLEDMLKLFTPALRLKEELGHPVNAIIAGKMDSSTIERVKKIPVSEIHVKKMDSPEGVLDFLRDFVKEKKPFVLIGSVSGAAHDAFPYLAQELDAGYLGGGLSLSLSPEDNKVVVKRKIYGGLLVETVKNLKDGVQFVTMEIATLESPEEGEPQEVEVQEW